MGLGWVEVVGFGGMVGERFEKVVGMEEVLERRELNPTGLAARSYSVRLQPQCLREREGARKGGRG